MKTTTLVLILFLTAHGLWAQTPPPSLSPNQIRQLQLRQARAAATNAAAALAASPANPGFSAPPAGAPASVAPTTATPGMPAVSTDSADSPDKDAAGITFTYDGVDVNQVLDVYADLVGRTLIRGPVPQASIVLKTQSPLTRTEAIEALQAVLDLNGITFVNIGEKFVKVVAPDQAAGAGGAVNTNDAAQLPEMGPYVTMIKQLKFVKPSVMQPLIAPFGRLANSITPIDDNGILVIRDYAENVKRMLEMIEKIDVNVPAVYISEVIPIRYAKVDDIANALNSLGGSGGATVAIGSSPSAAPISGIAGNRPTGTAVGGMAVTTQPGVNGSAGAPGQPRTAANPNGTPSGTPTTLQQRLLNIVNNASGGTGAGGKQEPIQLFGQTKIIPNESSSSLLIYATRPDMDAITNIIAKLDVPLAQVLIEAVIVNYTLGNTFDFGVSAEQNPITFSPSQGIAGGGVMNNSQPFASLLNFANGRAVNNYTGNGNYFGTNSTPGLSYFGNLGPSWNVALQAAQSDSHASIIQRPRIQTSQAVPAQFFVGKSVPYITGSYSYNGVQNSYSQLSVGVELDVTPFINPEGAVSMQIQQEIDAIDNDNYNETGQPSTIKRTLNTTITVRNKDTVMLGGFIEADKSHSQAGVPFLSDIPLLGNLFKKRDDTKSRQELIVLMRPTVLGTPELAAKNTFTEEQRLPGISASYAEDVAEQNKLVEAERKAELKNPKIMSGGFFSAPLPTNAPSDQLPQPQNQGDDLFSPMEPNAPVIPANTNNTVPMPTP
jgi:general secretion pathway protein D